MNTRKTRNPPVLFCCETCRKEFVRYRSLRRGQHSYCSRACVDLHRPRLRRASETVAWCEHCGREFAVLARDLRKRTSRGKHIYCSNACSRARLKVHRRSKLEVWLQERLTETHPSIDVRYNDRKVVGVELDIYIPSLQLAFELNGPCHYVPIYGVARFAVTQNRDKLKAERCALAGIHLCVVDVSQMGHFTVEKGLPVLGTILRAIG